LRVMAGAPVLKRVSVCLQELIPIFVDCVKEFNML